ncbi:hypothetical protein LJR153_001682 [Paenibacillus sp. LjRoot153]|uniref:hypothetical protein n=1 Tax=Paenibacillus sp. LjRoot153 TaxID=3342270 RepID=UPI003ED027F8
MEELLNVVSEGINKINTNIARNKKYFDYPFTTNCGHFYKLLLLHSQVECWEQFLKLLNKFKGDRDVTFTKQCEEFEKRITIEKSMVPGFVTQDTLNQMIEYMRTLEWKVEELLRKESHVFSKERNE